MNKRLRTCRRLATLHLLLSLIFCATSFTRIQAATIPTPLLLTYSELLELYKHEKPSEQLKLRMQTLLSTPFVNNDAWNAGSRPLNPQSPILGSFLRIAHWNIERGLEYEALESVFVDPAKFVTFLDETKYPPGSPKRQQVLEQARLLREADVIVLNEVDWGMKRSGYRNVVADLASALRMNYAYGTEFIEIDPIALGIEEFKGLPSAEQAALIQQIKIDEDRYKGLHGTAILSRFPLTNVRLSPFRHQGHDWYRAEKKGPGKVEKGKRKASELVFQEKVRREVRRGGRMILLADIEDPSLPTGRLTIVATHLEGRTTPSSRARQLQELLETVKEIKNPVVLAGDMNTSTLDATPTSIHREIKKKLGSKRYWLEQGLSFLTRLSWPSSLMLAGANDFRKQADPTVRSVPWVATNPEAKFFETLRRFRFADGGSFDFRGDRERSVRSGKSPLANSNQRGAKGFITTFEVERTIAFVGKFKLDWIFVKPPHLTSPYDNDQSYLFAPHFGRTLKELNHSFPGRISDHDPLIVDLPLSEPRIMQALD